MAHGQGRIQLSQVPQGLVIRSLFFTDSPGDIPYLKSKFLHGFVLPNFYLVCHP